ncbi:MAG: extracellular solute-binding protein [Spirochaetaceae bacterium]
MNRLFLVLLIFCISISAYSKTGVEEEQQVLAESVTLYSAHSQETINILVERFELVSGIKANVVRMGSADILTRVRVESGKPKCDVIWSVSGEQLEANNELLEDFTPSEWDIIDPVYKVGTKWLPYTGIIMVLLANTELLTPDELPKSWEDLTSSKFRNKISSARADKSGSSYTQLVTILNSYGDDGWRVYNNILKNMELSGSSSAVPKLVNSGEAAIGITLEDSAFRYFEAGGPVKIIYPEDGTTVAPDGIALVKNGPNPDAGKQFINWVLSKEIQDFLVEIMGRRSVRIDGAVSASLPKISDIKTIPYNFAEAAKNKDYNINKWSQLVDNLGY